MTIFDPTTTPEAPPPVWRAKTAAWFTAPGIPSREVLEDFLSSLSRSDRLACEQSLVERAVWCAERFAIPPTLYRLGLPPFTSTGHWVTRRRWRETVLGGAYGTHPLRPLLQIGLGYCLATRHLAWTSAHDTPTEFVVTGIAGNDVGFFGDRLADADIMGFCGKHLRYSCALCAATVSRLETYQVLGRDAVHCLACADHLLVHAKPPVRTFRDLRRLRRGG